MKILVTESQYKRIIKENKPGIDPPKTVEEIKAFQDWMDRYFPTWLNGGKLNKGSGYGTFGPKTKKAWDDYGIDYTFQVGGRSKADIEDFFNPNQMCKRKFNNEELKKAITWWKNWLANPTTVEKFKKNFGFLYYGYKTSAIFSNYNDLLDRIYLEHVWDIPEHIDKSFIAWVDRGILRDTIRSKQKIPIFISCKLADQENNVQRVLIHEIQHILNFLHPLGNQKSVGIVDEFISSWVSNSYFSEYWVDLLMKNGFDKTKSENITKSYIDLVKKDTEHLSINDEILSNLFEARYFLNLKPGQNITKQMVFNNFDKDSSIIMLIFQWMFSGEKNFQSFIDKWNLSAKKEIEKGNEDKYV